MKNSNREFNSIIDDIINNNKFNKLKKELHHGITRYDHSYRVARWTYSICDFFNMKNKDNAVRAALLHDFYIDKDLEDFNSYEKLGEHPNMALTNSLKYFELDSMQQDIIKNHMFPRTVAIPKCKESWLVSGVDKVVSTYEMLRFKAGLYLGIYLLFVFEVIKLPR